MTICGLDEESFKQTVRTYLTPARAISDPQYLRGRDAKLAQIDRASNSSGRHAFIFGDRGVGRTSLALSASVIHQRVDEGSAEPILISCDKGSTTFSLIQDIAKGILPPRDQIEKKKQTRGFKVSVAGLGWDTSQQVESGSVPAVTSVNDAVNLLKFITQYHSSEPVIIVDEFDQLTDSAQRDLFASLVKQVSDRETGVRFIITSIGKSLNDLIGSHFSTSRYLSPVELDRLTHDARWQIIRSAANALQLDISDEFVIRVGQISDGFPYYVHLTAEMIFWSVYRHPETVREVSYELFSAGLKEAAREAQPTLKKAYDLATQKYKNTKEYEEVLWAVVDKPHLRRQSREIYLESYLRVAEDRRPSVAPLDLDAFHQRMNKLRDPRHGSILETTSRGLHQFRENVLRGYVRLMAEEQGITLHRDVLGK